MSAAPMPPATSPPLTTETLDGGSHSFIILGYSLAKGIGVGKYILSDSFTVGGYKWAIFFYPDGKNPEDNSSYVSVFIGLASEGTDVRALFGVTLIDQSDEGKHRSLKSGPWPCTLNHRGGMWGYNRFFRRAMFENSNFLKDDCLRIHCTVRVVVPAIDWSRFLSIKVPESDNGSHIGTLLENEECSDITFDVKGEKFHAHKSVLAARSPVFKSEFFKSEDNREIVISDMEPKVFKALLHYIYKDTLVEDEELSVSVSSPSCITHTLVAKLMAAADEYDLPRLRLMCESVICKDISVNSVAKILALADQYHAMDLKNVCLKYAAENVVGVLRSDGFKYLKRNCPHLQSQLLKRASGVAVVAGCKDSCSIWARFPDGTTQMD